MRTWRGLALVLLAGALASLGWGALQGDLQVALLVVFPVVYGSGPWGVLGIGLLVGAFVAFFVDAATRFPEPPAGPGPRGDPDGSAGDHWEAEPGAAAEPEGSLEDEEDGSGFLSGGGVVLIGPIPIVVGSDKRTTVILMGLAVLIMVLGLAYVQLGA